MLLVIVPAPTMGDGEQDRPLPQATEVTVPVLPPPSTMFPLASPTAAWPVVILPLIVANLLVLPEAVPLVNGAGSCELSTDDWVAIGPKATPFVLVQVKPNTPRLVKVKVQSPAPEGATPVAMLLALP